MTIASLLACALLSPVMVAAAGPSPDCLTSKYDQYALAQETWQKGLTRLIVQVVPRYEEVAQIYLTDQLRSIEEARLAVNFLAHQEPAKLRDDKPLNEWLNLSETDEQRIAESNGRYAELLGLRAARRERPPHPDGDGLRAVMRSTVMRSPQYQELLQAFSRAVGAAENIQCP